MTLDLSGVDGFLPPLRNDSGPYSAHKPGSTIPHKFNPPLYADGSPAIDLSGGLRLVLQWVTGGGAPDDAADEYAAGSTAWRYDTTDGHYIFNLKSEKTWQIGTWRTTVSYAGVVLASTSFVLNK